VVACAGPVDPKLPWGGGDTALCKGTYVFAYILAFLYILLFFLLFVFRDAARKLYIPPEKALTSPLASEEKHHGAFGRHGKKHDVTPAATSAAAAPAAASTGVPEAVPPPAAQGQPDAHGKDKHGWFGRHKKGDSATDMPSAHAGTTGGGGISPEDIRPVVVRPGGTNTAGEAQPAV
jgi:hypothetical protein